MLWLPALHMHTVRIQAQRLCGGLHQGRLDAHPMPWPGPCRGEPKTITSLKHSRPHLRLKLAVHLDDAR